jgi:hypothetical protein
MDAMVEQKRLEDSGIGDELMEMQLVLWPVEQLRAKDFVMDVLFEYEDNDGSTLMWCQGKIVDFIREVKDKHVFVKIEWNDKYVRDGDSKVTKNQLKKTKWNPNTPVGGAWREDLHHKIMNREYFFRENTSKTVTYDVCEYVCSFVGGMGSGYYRNTAVIIKIDQFC